VRLLALAIGAAALGAGCASFDGRSLVPGKSTAAEVEALMGPPDQKLAEPGGDSVWYFSRQPMGLQIFAARIAPDGILRAIDQRLTEENLRKLLVGVTTAADTRALLGPPWRVSRNARLQREIWDYRMYNQVQVEHTLSVQFSDDGLVREVLLLRDHRDEPRWRRRG
jgi:hypothetical protein